MTLPPDPDSTFNRPSGLDALLDHVAANLPDMPIVRVMEHFYDYLAKVSEGSPALHLLTTTLALDSDLDADEAHMVTRQVLAIHALELAVFLAETRGELSGPAEDRSVQGMRHAESVLRLRAEQLASEVEPTRPRSRIVCLCGSTRFMAEMAEANFRETAAGRIVLAPGVDMKAEHPLWADPDAAAVLKTRLDELHLEKIRMADEVLVVGDYIGDSTRREIAYARSIRRPVRFTHPEVDPARLPEATS